MSNNGTSIRFAAAILATLALVNMAGAFSGAGSGTENDPYIITNVYQLQEMSNDLDAWYELGNDIDASDTINWNGGAGFVPIGPPRFLGSLDGQGYNITDLYMNYTSFYEGYVGIFSTLAGTVKNIGFVNVNITGDDGVGTIAGCIDGGGFINNSFVTGNMRLIDDLYDLGGLVGVIYNGKIDKSYAIINISCGGEDCGGLVGYNYGNITNSYAIANIIGNDYIGGLVGWNDGYYGGGFIVNSYASGTITGNEYVGGLVGYNEGTISNSYSTGKINAPNDVGYVGGFVGYNEGDCNSSYWDIETSGQTKNACGEGKTTAEMQTKSTFTNVGWDFVNIWTIREGVDYPRFIWQTEPEPEQLLADLIDYVAGLNLEAGVSTSLMAKLNTAKNALEDGNENNDVAAINALVAFINAVEAQRGKKISVADADALIEAAQQIIDLLNNG